MVVAGCGLYALSAGDGVWRFTGLTEWVTTSVGFAGD